MVVHSLEFTAPDLAVPRMHPCAAWIDQAGRGCGATPAWLHRRVCLHSHTRDIWLCRTHEAMITRIGDAICRDCAAPGRWAHACPVTLVENPDAVALIRANGP